MNLKNFITLAGVIIVSSFLVFLYNCIVGLADFAGRINPLLSAWVFWLLFGAVVSMLAWMAAVAFMRPKPMMVYADPTDADREKFERELVKRLGKNKYLRETGIEVRDQADMGVGLTALKQKADEEIKSTAKQVFIGTAVSQNGRLDTLVVLYLISRLTWRIATLYNQRPHYRELINLYANIAATSFLAGSIEEFGIEEYIGELMGPLVGGSAVGAVPGAQAIASTITASVLTGTTNSLLALRCGVVARDYVSLNLDAKGTMRRSATVEASKMFVTMSAETVTYVTKLLVKSSAGAVKSGTSKAVKGVGSTISGTAESVGNSARKVGRGVKSTAGAVGDGAKKVGQGVKDTAGTVGDGARKVGEKVKGAVGSVGEKAKGVRQGVRDKAGKVGGLFKKAGQDAKGAGLSMKEKAVTVLHEGVEKIDSAKTTAESALAGLKKKGQKAAQDVATNGSHKKEADVRPVRSFVHKVLRRKKD